MVISNLNVKNKTINFKNLNLNFNEVAIYRILGKIGSGKTSILKEIVFGKYEVKFLNNEDLIAWNHNRGSLFSYIPQAIIDVNLSVYDYITKSNFISREKIIEYLNKFNLEESILEKGFNYLSGGEKKKIQIISALLKDTKYIFIDEPTNNLDNESAKILSNIIKEVSKECVVVLITHDNRLDLEYNTIYEIHDNEIILKKIKHNYKLNKKLSELKKKRLNILKKIVLNKSQIATIIMFYMFFIFVNSFLFVRLKEEYNNDFVIKENLVLLKYGNMYNEQLYENYVKSEKIIIKEENYDKYFTLNDMQGLINQDFLDIYIIDHFYVLDISYKVINKTAINDFNFIAFPNIYYEAYEYSLIDFCKNLEVGRYPVDYQDEVVISKNMLIKYFGYDEISSKDAINDIIQIDILGEKKDFKIVGLNYSDIIHLSYDDKYDFGVYHFNENTYKDFGDKLINKAIEKDGIIGAVYEMLLITNNERNLSNYLITNYPSCNVISNYVDSIWIRNYNKTIVLKNTIIFAIFSFIIGLIYMFINKNTIKNNINIIKEYECYYLDKLTFKRNYILSTIGIYIMSFIVMIISNIFLEYTLIINLIISICFIITMIPLMISFLILFRRKND